MKAKIQTKLFLSKFQNVFSLIDNNKNAIDNYWALVDQEQLNNMITIDGKSQPELMAKLNITMNKLFRDSLQYTSSDFVEVIDIILNITDSIGLEHSFLSEESVWPFVSNLIEHLYQGKPTYQDFVQEMTDRGLLFVQYAETPVIKLDVQQPKAVNLDEQMQIFQVNDDYLNQVYEKVQDKAIKKQQQILLDKEVEEQMLKRPRLNIPQSQTLKQVYITQPMQDLTKPNPEKQVTDNIQPLTLPAQNVPTMVGELDKQQGQFIPPRLLNLRMQTIQTAESSYEEDVATISKQDQSILSFIQCKSEVIVGDQVVIASVIPQKQTILMPNQYLINIVRDTTVIFLIPDDQTIFMATKSDDVKEWQAWALQLFSLVRSTSNFYFKILPQIKHVIRNPLLDIRTPNSGIVYKNKVYEYGQYMIINMLKLYQLVNKWVTAYNNPNSIIQQLQRQMMSLEQDPDRPLLFSMPNICLQQIADMPSSAITATAPNGSSVIDMVQALYNARRDMREKKSYSSEEVRLYCLARSLILELLPEDVLDLDIITAHYLFVILGLYFLLMAIKFWVIGLDRDTNQQFWGDLNQDNEFMAMLEAEFQNRCDNLSDTNPNEVGVDEQSFNTLVYAMKSVDNGKMKIIQQTLDGLLQTIEEGWDKSIPMLNSLIADLTQVNKVQVSMCGYRVDDRVDQCKFVYYGQQQVALTQKQVMEYKSKGLWRQKGLTKANIEKFNTFKKINYKVTKSAFSTQLAIYQALQLIDKDVQIIQFRGDTERQMQFGLLQFEIKEDDDINIDKLAQSQFSIKPYSNERNCTVLPIRQRLITVTNNFMQTNTINQLQAQVIQDMTYQYEVGSGYNLLGIINRLSQFTKTHKQCVDSYVKNYGNEDGTIYYKSNSNEYYHGSNSIFKEIPNNWISGLYTMNNESALFQELAGIRDLQQLFSLKADGSRGPSQTSPGFLLGGKREANDEREKVLGQAMINIVMQYQTFYSWIVSQTKFEQDQNFLDYKPGSLGYNVKVQFKEAMRRQNSSKVGILIQTKLIFQSQYGRLDKFYVKVSHGGNQIQIEDQDNGGLVASGSAQDLLTLVDQLSRLSDSGVALALINREQSYQQLKKIIEISGHLSIMINKLEVYDAPKIKPSKFAVSFEEFSQNKDIQTLLSKSPDITLDDIKNFYNQGDSKNTVIRIVNGVNFWVLWLQAVLRDIVKESLVPQTIHAMDLSAGNPIQILQHYKQDWERQLNIQKDQHIVKYMLDFQQVNMPGDQRMAPNVGSWKTRVETRYSLSNYSDNLYVYFKNGVHMSWDLKKSECGSQRWVVQYFNKLAVTVLSRLFAKTGMSTDQALIVAQVQFYLNHYASKPCYQVNTIAGDVLLSTPGLQSGVPITFWINHIRSSLLVWYDKYVESIFDQRWIDFVLQDDYVLKLAMNNNTATQWMANDNVFDGQVDPTSNQLIPILSRKAAQLCMESSQVWKIEKVTVLTDSWLVTRVWDTDMLGFQMTRMGNTYIPSLDSNRMWKSIVFQKDQQLEQIVEIAGTQLINSKPSIIYGFKYIRTQQIKKQFQNWELQGKIFNTKWVSSQAIYDIKGGSKESKGRQVYRDSLVYIKVFGVILICLNRIEGQLYPEGEDPLQVGSDLLYTIMNVLEIAKFYSLQYYAQGNQQILMFIQLYIRSLINDVMSQSQQVKEIIGMLQGITPQDAQEVSEKTTGEIRAEDVVTVFQMLPRIIKSGGYPEPLAQQIAVTLLPQKDDRRDQIVQDLIQYQGLVKLNVQRETLQENNIDNMIGVDKQRILINSIKNLYRAKKISDYQFTLLPATPAAMLAALGPKYTTTKQTIRLNSKDLDILVQSVLTKTFYENIRLAYKIYHENSGFAKEAKIAFKPAKRNRVICNLLLEGSFVIFPDEEGRLRYYQSQDRTLYDFWETEGFFSTRQDVQFKSNPLDIKSWNEIAYTLYDRARIFVQNTFLKDREAIIAIIFLHLVSVIIPYVPKVKIRLNTQPIANPTTFVHIMTYTPGLKAMIMAKSDVLDGLLSQQDLLTEEVVQAMFTQGYIPIKHILDGHAVVTFNGQIDIIKDVQTRNRIDRKDQK